MILIAKLDNATEQEKIDFIVEYNHNQGYEIKEEIVNTEEVQNEEGNIETVNTYNLEAWGYAQEELVQFEKERTAKLFLTGADVERGIYKAKSMDFDDILAFVSANPPDGLDIKALKIELKANNFYRGNPYVSAIGTLLGFTEEQLDKFFETNDYTVLIDAPNVHQNNQDIIES